MRYKQFKQDELVESKSVAKAMKPLFVQFVPLSLRDKPQCCIPADSQELEGWDDSKPGRSLARFCVAVEAGLEKP